LYGSVGVFHADSKASRPGVFRRVSNGWEKPMELLLAAILEKGRVKITITNRDILSNGD
jgi:hypothetical protein